MPPNITSATHDEDKRYRALVEMHMIHKCSTAVNGCKKNEECKFYNVNSDTIPLNVYGKNKNQIDYYEKKNPIPNYIKNLNKSLNSKNIEKHITEFPLDCSNLCNNRKWCKSFDYNKTTNECFLKDKNKDDIPLINNNLYDNYSLNQSKKKNNK